MAFDYASTDWAFNMTDLTVCAAFVTEQTGITPTDIKVRLGLSAGTDPAGVTVYRPWFVAARILANRKIQLLGARGADFVDPLLIAEELMRTQAGIDLRLGLTVPPGMEAVMRVIEAAFGGFELNTIGTW